MSEESKRAVASLTRRSLDEQLRLEKMQTANGERHMLHGARGQVCAAVQLCVRLPMRSVGTGALSLHPENSPPDRMPVLQPLSPGPKPTHQREAPAGGCKLRFPESLVAPRIPARFGQ